jgi:hypothetical protein
MLRGGGGPARSEMEPGKIYLRQLVAKVVGRHEIARKEDLL